MKSKTKDLYLKNFEGQLEKDSDGKPYWHIILETNIVTTSRCVAKSISKKLFGIKYSMDRRVLMESLLKFEEFKKENRLLINNPNFSPGFFNKEVLTIEELLKNKEIQEWFETRKKFQNNIDNIDIDFDKHNFI